MKCISLGLFAVFCYVIAMTYEPEQHGYSKPETKALSKLIERETQPRGKKNWTPERQAAALQYLWGQQ